jgi:hypothetical protein
MSDDRIRLDLTREETGTLLGSIAWVMGALQIMRDRGHAEADEEFHELHDLLVPRLEALLARVTRARQDAPGTPRLEADLEAAYTAIRSAFESWIELTAVDTLSAAVAERLAGQGGTGTEGGPETPAQP